MRITATIGNWAGLAWLIAATAASAQQPTPLPTPPAPVAPGAPTLCGQPVPEPARLPPADSGPLVYVLGLCFDAQNNQSAVEPETYLYYLRLRPSRPSQSEWVPFDESTRATICAIREFDSASPPPGSENLATTREVSFSSRASWGVSVTKKLGSASDSGSGSEQSPAQGYAVGAPADRC